MSKKHYEYDVALSFAEEDHALVECVVAALKEKGVNPYYYKEKTEETWGEQLDHMLREIYGKKSRLCVIFYSKHYVAKQWTNFEMNTAQRRQTRNIRTYILPLKLDDTSLPKALGKVVYAPVQDCAVLAEMIYKKVERAKKPVPVTEQLKHFISRPRNAVSLALLAIGIVLFPDQLLPAEVLARRLYDRTAVHSFAVCRDGNISYAHGRGACSHHLGVDHYVEDTVSHTRTMEQCEEDAREISWFSK